MLKFGLHNLSRVNQLGLLICLLSSTVATCASDLPVNLAKNKPATSSSIENDDHDASHANDAKLETCWRADDEPMEGPEWWQVDLGNVCNLTGVQITWPYDGMNYRCKVEGSADQKQWQLLSDQTQSTSRARIQRLIFDRSNATRYVRVTITKFDEGCWASLSEVEVFGSVEPHH